MKFRLGKYFSFLENIQPPQFEKAAKRKIDFTSSHRIQNLRWQSCLIKKDIKVQISSNRTGAIQLVADGGGGGSLFTLLGHSLFPCNLLVTFQI